MEGLAADRLESFLGSYQLDLRMDLCKYVGMAEDIADLRKDVHDEIDRLTDEEIVGLKEFLSTYPDKLAAVFRNAPLDDEPFTEEDRRLLAEAEEWREQNGGRGIPHDEVMRDLGLI